MEITKVYRQDLPAVKLTGKRFTNADRNENGTFGHLWQQAFQEGWFDTLEKGRGIPGVSEDYLGAMRVTGDGDHFEYWIGVFLAPDAEVPEGFEAVEIPAGAVGVCWLHGQEANGEIYSAQASDLCMAAMAEKGWSLAEGGWFFERYNCPRFTTPDESGQVILDIGAYLV